VVAHLRASTSSPERRPGVQPRSGGGSGSGTQANPKKERYHSSAGDPASAGAGAAPGDFHDAAYPGPAGEPDARGAGSRPRGSGPSAQPGGLRSRKRSHRRGPAGTAADGNRVQRRERGRGPDPQRRGRGQPAGTVAV